MVAGPRAVSGRGVACRSGQEACAAEELDVEAGRSGRT
ncbi:hypothetical protein SLNWT_6280 [Streptomyces albus]|uniref:Uncharacterized protein n=1 Tax=Streptomyces albus (strain ATCC 21838 / DSM 41398 / FERM P-419 / JCM 4703 / NBRC 107858) TaxID=1081613 RepID=A0A0B5F6Z7_STRA4|nr:hypothetical protein SLNWT_6280 [Streptomyces albus]AOU80961.1 hypothetical protein SLNHY_6270 [Streptomyces albus]AYN36663.1 hypothetical protein DUI70_6169 [Streptomyces albus]